MNDLARHPSTARHIASKLVRHFVADIPPPALVEQVAQIFQDTDGDLTQVTLALLESPAAWKAEQRKFKTPQEFVISALRGLGIGKSDIEAKKIIGSMMLMGQRPFAPPSPEGWADVADHWASPDGVLRRVEWAAVLADKVGSRVDPSQFLDWVLGPLASPTTRQAVARAATVPQGIALAFASPEFQRR